MSQENPFGPEVEKYWDRRYTLFKRFDEGVQVDKEGLYSVCPEDVALEIARHVKAEWILDAFGGIAGNAIAFAREKKRVTCIDINPQRLALAMHNAAVYGVADQITFQEADYLEYVHIAKEPAVFLDPPWGGPGYSSSPVFLLSHFSPDGNTLLKLAFEHFSEVILRVPRTFAIEELEKFGRPYELVDNVSDGRIISRTVYFS